MCTKCKTPDVIVRLERQVAALNGAGNLNPETIKAVMADAAALLKVYLAANTAMDLVLASEAAEVVIEPFAPGSPPHGRPH